MYPAENTAIQVATNVTVASITAESGSTVIVSGTRKLPASNQVTASPGGIVKATRSPAAPATSARTYTASADDRASAATTGTCARRAPSAESPSSAAAAAA